MCSVGILSTGGLSCPEGRPQYLKSIHDISEGQSALGQEEYRQLFESASDGVILGDNEMETILETNAAAFFQL